MYFYNLIKEFSKEKSIALYVDMDGVIAEYGIGRNPYDYLNKRPLKTNIETLKEVSSLENIELHILSVCREDFQIEDKNIWLDKNAPFFDRNNRNIISRASNEWKNSRELKVNFLENLKTEKQIVLIDDDNEILGFINKNFENIIVMQDSELID